MGSLIDYIRGSNEELAYVIVEPVELDWSYQRKGKLKVLRHICTQRGIKLIFDEVITGFRVPQYCFSQLWEIEPDLICFGKPIANGFPISVVGGRSAIMNTPDYFVSYTFAGDEASLTAAINTIDTLTERNIKKLWIRGGWFQSELNELDPCNIMLSGFPTRAVWCGDIEYKAKFWQGMLDKGILCGKAMFINLAHTEDVLLDVLEVAENVMKEISEGKIKLRGSLPKEVFKRNAEARD
jgi:glutamate-1-semialdehyde 2,1-aminomutase